MLTRQFIIGQHAIGQMSGSGLFALTLLQLQHQESKHNQQTAVALPYGLGLILCVLLIFTYYIGYQIPMPFTNSFLPAIVAILISLIALIAVLTYPPHPPISTESLLMTPFYAIIFVFIFNVRQELSLPYSGNDNHIRIMTYNLHNGFHPYGYLDLEAIAQVIENEDADIVALQEVSRGWLINGSTDMLTWLSQRLDMPYIFNPTTDLLWGNALLSRYPIINHQPHTLPPDSLPLTRGFIAAEINIGNAQTINIIATHLHHSYNDSQIRQQQAQVIVDYAQSLPHTIIMGDLNAEPDSPEMQLFHKAGFTDILTNEQPNFTYYSLDPDRQIDYIWLTPDLTADHITIPPIPASDHLGVAATIRP